MTPFAVPVALNDERSLRRLAAVVVAMVFAFRILPMVLAWIGSPVSAEGIAASPFTLADVVTAQAYDRARWLSVIVEILTSLAFLAGLAAIAQRDFFRRDHRGVIIAAVVLAVVVTDAFLTLGVRTLLLHPVDVAAGISRQSTAAFFFSGAIDAGTTAVLDGLGLALAFFVWRWRRAALLLVAPLLALVSTVAGWTLVATIQPILTDAISPARASAECPTSQCASVIDAIENARMKFAPNATFVVVKTSVFDSRIQAFASGAGPMGTLWLYDSTLTQLGPSAATSMVFHELGHLVFVHALWEALFDVAAALLFAIVWLWVDRPRFRMRAPRPLPALLAWLMVAMAFQTIEDPVRVALRRTFEVQADAFALEHQSAAAFVAVEVKGAHIARLRLNPHPVARWIFQSHPSPLERIETARRQMRLEEANAARRKHHATERGATE